MKNQSESDKLESEAEKWLQVALAKENLDSLSLDMTGNSEKGDGYIGEIHFLVAKATDKFGQEKDYNLVVKSSKTSPALLKAFPIREAFIREIYVYENIFPVFRKFQTERGVPEPFDSVPRCYGTYTDGLRYVVILENLRKAGFVQWKIDQTLTREHIDLVIREYAKFHAISIAMKEQQPEKFQELIDGIEDDVSAKIFQLTDLVTPSVQTIEETAELLKDDLSDDILKKWLSFKDQMPSICSEIKQQHEEDLQVIIHADCWNNNFLYKHKDDQNLVPDKVAILDWQICRYYSPLFDLAYFLFSCISEEDVNDIETILRTYHANLCEHVTKIGSSVTVKYPVEKLLEEWKKYSKFGLWNSLLPLKSAYSSKEQLPDMTKSAENGEFASAFIFGISDKIGCKNRFRPLVKYAVEANLI